MRERQRAEMCAICWPSAASCRSPTSWRRPAFPRPRRGATPAVWPRPASPSASTAASRRSAAPSPADTRRRSRRGVRRQPHDQHRGQARDRPQARVEMCVDGDVIIVNGGTTTFQMSEFLRQHATEGPDQLLSAGRISHPRDANRVALARRRGLSRPKADRRAVRRRRDPALFGAAHVHERDLDRPARRDRGRSADRARGNELLRRADKLIVLADASKFAPRGSLVVCPLSRIHALITDHAAPPEALAMLRDAGVQTIVVDLETRATEAA